MSKVTQTYAKIKKWPAGNWLFGKIVGLSAPFFSNIHPKFIDLRKAYCQVQIKDRRSIRNHIGSINAGALCSLAELVGGLALDSCVPSNMRWIPKGMTVNYVAKARGTITGTSDLGELVVQQGDIIVPVKVLNAQGKEVFNAEITFVVSEKPAV